MHSIKEEPDENKNEDEDEDDDEERRRESLSKVKVRERIRSLGSGWLEYVTPSGRYYYYNSVTKEKSWKPPRKGIEKTRMSLQDDGDGGGGGGDGGSSSIPQTFDSRLSLPEYSVLEITKPGNVGKILRTGILKTKSLNGNYGDDHDGGGGSATTGKWVKSFVVLTELYVLFTAMMGTFKKLFTKKKHFKPVRFFLLNAEVTKEERVKKKRLNVYKLTTDENCILFRSKNSKVGESWYQAFSHAVNNFKVVGKNNQLIETPRYSSESSDTTKKSTSMMDFTEDTNNKRTRIKCLSDYIGGKYPTPPGWITIFDSDTKEFCYVNSITSKKWFHGLTDDGHPYFYEEETGRRSWVLPSIYLDVHYENLQKMGKLLERRRSINSVRSNNGSG